MFKIGVFSRLSMLTVTALRFYEKEDLLIPTYVDEKSGYRFYEASQLDFSEDDIRTHLGGVPLQDALRANRAELT